MVYLNQHHMLPVQRPARLMRDLFGLPTSQATVIFGRQGVGEGWEAISLAVA